MTMARHVAEARALQERRNDYDVTNTVKVSSVRHVSRAVRRLFLRQYPRESFDAVAIAFLDFDRLYSGRHPDYHAVDTTYHDMQHSLDMTLALARLISGFESSGGGRLGPERARCLLISALFHDSGYLRHKIRDRDADNGAVFTTTHVSRSSEMLRDYLPEAGLKAFSDVAARMVHYTGYEIPIEDIGLEDVRDRQAGELLGTADLVAQMADRCYLEKCRDRLYPEFVLGRIAVNAGASGSSAVYRSGRDLLQKTIGFYQSSAKKRLETTFRAAYRNLDHFFGDGPNLYMSFIERNLSFLSTLEQRGTWTMLRRRPPCAVPDPRGEAKLVLLALGRLRSISDEARETTRQLRALTVDHPPSVDTPPA